jgi:ubiquitin carboxyl-terminal hydrolase 4/11
MGGAVELPQRSSSPLKRRASDLEPELSAGHEEDVEMEALPSPDHHNTIPETECNGRETTQSSKLDTALEILKDVDGDRNQMVEERNIPNEININMSGSPPNGMPLDFLCNDNDLLLK